MPFDANDPDTKAAIKAATAEAVAEATERLEAKRNELITEIRTLKKGRTIDPADLEKAEEERDTLAAKVKELEKAASTATKAAETATAALAAEQGRAERLLVDNGLAAALSEAGVKDPALHRAAMSLLRETGKPTVAIEGDARIVKIGDKVLTDFAKEWAQSAEGKSFVSAPGHTGGGAAGGKDAGPVNPWAKESYNMTEQGKLYKENPAQAKSLASQAGVQLD